MYKISSIYFADVHITPIIFLYSILKSDINLFVIISFTKECRDVSLKVALNSVKKDLAMSKGSLVTLHAQPRIAAKKNIYIIGILF